MLTNILRVLVTSRIAECPCDGIVQDGVGEVLERADIVNHEPGIRVEYTVAGDIATRSPHYHHGTQGTVSGYTIRGNEFGSN